MKKEPKESTFDNSNIMTNSKKLEILTKNFPQRVNKNIDFRKSYK